MTEAQTDTTGQEEIVEPQPEDEIEDAQPEEGVQPEGAEQPEEIKETPDDTGRELWGKAVPELADQFDKLEGSVRERILTQRLLAAQPAGESPTEVSSAKTDDPTEQGRQPAEPPATEVPEFDDRDIKARLVEALGEEEGSAVGGAIDHLMAWNKALGEVVISGFKGLRQDITESRSELTSYTRPQKIHALLPGVRGATEADVKAASRLMDSGEVTTELGALKLAVANRTAEVAEVVPGPDAKKKAAALEASRDARGPRRGGQPGQKIPVGEKGYREMLAADEKRGKTK